MALRRTSQALPPRFVSLFRPPWVIWRKHTPQREITVELRYVTPIICAVALLVIHLSGATTATAMLLVVALATVLASILWARQMALHVYAERRLDARWVQVGDVMEERFVLSNDSGFPALWAEIVDQSDVPGYNAGDVRAVGGNLKTHWIYSGTATRRGQFHLGPWSVETGDPFGMFLVRIHYPQTRPLLVYPPIAEMPFPSLPRGASPGPSRINLTAPTPTVNAGQVRSYELGDPFRHIHWPSTARHDQLMVKMFDQEASANVWLLVDTDPAVQSGQGDSSTEEVGVIVAASLAADLLREGRAVGLVAHTFAKGSLIPPARSLGHLWTILGQLAGLPAANDRLADSRRLPLANVLDELGRTLRTGSNVVIVTPSNDPAWTSSLAHLAWRQIVPTVILIDPAPEGRLTMAAMAEQLAMQGVASRTVRCDIPLALRPALGKTRRWEFKTLATGRVIMTSEGVR